MWGTYIILMMWIFIELSFEQCATDTRFYYHNRGWNQFTDVHYYQVATSDFNNEVYACGMFRTSSYNSAMIHGFTSTGTQKFMRRYGDSGEVVCRSLVASPVDAFFYTAGYSYTGGITCNGGWDAIMAKYDITGVQQWMYTFGGTSTETLSDITISSDGTTLYAVGETYSYTYGNNDQTLVAYTSAGVMLFYRRYGCYNNDFLHGISIDYDNKYLFMSGGTMCYSNGGGIWDLMFHKFDLSLNKPEFSLVLGHTTRHDYSHRNKHARYDDSIYMTAVTNAGANNLQGGGFAKVSKTGVLVYAMKYGGTSSSADWCADLDVNEDGRIVYLACLMVSTGFTASSGTNSAFLVKINGLTGAVIRSIRYDQERSDYSYALAVDKYGHVAWTTASDSWGNYQCSCYYDGTTILYYLGATVMRLSPEMNDYNSHTVVTTATVALTDWKYMKLSDGVNFIDITLTAGQICTINPTYYTPGGFGNYNPFTKSSLTPPIMEDVTYKVGDTINLAIDRFCWGTGQTYADSIGYDIDITSLPPGLVFNWATQILKGTLTTAGFYSIKVFKTYTTYISSSTFLMTITGGGASAQVGTFLMSPNKITAGTYFEYTITPSSIFTYDGTQTITGHYYTNRGTNTSVQLSSALWLNFHSTNFTFTGFFSSAYFIANSLSLPYSYEIFLKITDTQNNVIYSNSDNITIVNQVPYQSQDITLPKKICLALNEPVIYAIQDQYFIEDDSQSLTRSLNILPSGAFPLNGLYFDSGSSTLYGTPTVAGTWNMQLVDSDGFASGSFTFQMIVSSRPSYDTTGTCGLLTAPIIQRTSPFISSLNYRACMQDTSQTLLYKAKFSNGTALPSFMTMNAISGELRINTTDSLTSGVYSIVVTAEQNATSGEGGCFNISIVSTLTINTPVSVAMIPSTYYAYTGVPFYLPISTSGIFYDPDTSDLLYLTTSDLSTTPFQLSGLNYILYGTPSAAQSNKSYEFTVYAKDRYSNYPTAQVLIKVNTTNLTAPVALSESQVFETMGLQNFTFQLDRRKFNYTGSIVFYFLDWNYSIANYTWLTFDSGNFTLSGYAPNVTTTTIYSFRFYFVDSNQSSGNMTINITIYPILTPVKMLQVNYNYNIMKNQFFLLKIPLNEIWQSFNTSLTSIYFIQNNPDQWPLFISFNPQNSSLYGYVHQDVEPLTTYKLEINAVDSTYGKKGQPIIVQVTVLDYNHTDEKLIGISQLILIGAILLMTTFYITMTQQNHLKPQKKHRITSLQSLNDSQRQPLKFK